MYFIACISAGMRRFRCDLSFKRWHRVYWNERIPQGKPVRTHTHADQIERKGTEMTGKNAREQQPFNRMMYILFKYRSTDVSRGERSKNVSIFIHKIAVRSIWLQIMLVRQMYSARAVPAPPKPALLCWLTVSLPAHTEVWCVVLPSLFQATVNFSHLEMAHYCLTVMFTFDSYLFIRLIAAANLWNIFASFQLIEQKNQ